jgi:hypothetical protein
MYPIEYGCLFANLKEMKFFSKEINNYDKHKFIFIKFYKFLLSFVFLLLSKFS